FAGGPGRVWVNARRDPGGLCVLEVRDDGRGIPPDFDWTTTSSLGLRLVRALTRQLRGDVTLERSHGTAFKVTFALHPGGKAKPELPDASAGPSIRSYSSSASR
ncbi:MAG TPA: ATP-binding protein, partial [Polyangiaceae bacterium]|nr:ATP-binding protein [Polyangiaceae bacterium]